MVGEDKGPLLPRQRGEPVGGSRPVTFDDFYRSHYRLLVKIVMLAGAPIHDAEDAVQRAMIDLLGVWDKVDVPTAWVRVAAVRYFVRAKRKLAAAIHLQNSAIMGADDDGRTSTIEEKGDVMALIMRLPERQREVFALAFDGLAPTEIAELFGDNPATIRANLRLARERLKGEMEAIDGSILPLPHKKLRED